ncbi:Fip1-domain-containing protein [Lentinus tigrinus ALCF2SS1-6]|uniref:Fip1-domain-containing protein n=1 Tax=Lentinus tigrinus ALCF2SS1-6 TaxID=1328759 RepID=A0A5C2SMX3_9APHY|nr:Fip1-domain-containing protein [Lentinus tigrinus ALCF2SS1-6]
MDDDDSYLYGDPAEDVKPAAAAVQTTVPQPISLDTTRSVSEGLVAKLEQQAADADEDGAEEEPAENGGHDEDEDEDDSDEDVEIIMEEPQSRRSLDLRPNRPAPRSTSQTFNTPQRAQPPPSLTTEYTPRERGTLTKQSSTPQPVSQSQTPLPPVAATPGTTEKLAAEAEKQESKDAGPDPNTLPPAKAPPSHPSINPSAPGMFDGRSILEVDLNALADKPWRRPGSDISDWFNYGFDEISWEAYCYRRRELGDLAGMLKNNVVNFAGMPEDQLIALPPEVRTMVMAGATTVMAGGGGGGGGGGMMPPGAGMNMNGGPMMNQMMNMGGMMNPMMEMGVGMGDIGMMQEGGGGGGGGPQGGGQGNSEGQVGMGMGVGEGFGPGGGAPGQGMMGMGMNPEFAMQDPSGMGQQMYPGMEGTGTPTPVPTGPSRGLAQGQFRGRGMQQGLGMRGRGAGFPGRGRGAPVRPASPLPPNVPTGPRNKNKYKDIDGSAPAVDGLDYGGGGGGGERDRSERSERSERSDRDHKDRKDRGTPDLDERDRSSRKRRGSPGEREESSRSSKRR